MKILIRNILLFLFSLTFFPTMSFSQDNKNERIGLDEILKTGTNYYNYSDKDKVNIEVSIWGYVRNPGRYLIPIGTSAIDLITLSGGPQNEAKLEDIRILRLKNDSLHVSENKIINLNYNDFLWEKEINNPNKQNPQLLPGDLILIPGGPRYQFRDNLGIVLSVTSVLVSVAILLVTIFRN